jgi:hypothetical protein
MASALESQLLAGCNLNVAERTRLRTQHVMIKDTVSVTPAVKDRFAPKENLYDSGDRYGKALYERVIAIPKELSLEGRDAQLKCTKN